MSTKKTATIQLPIQSNEYGIPCAEDFLAEIQRMYDIEKNVKNSLYGFISERGLFNEFKEYMAGLSAVKTKKK